MTAITDWCGANPFAATAIAIGLVTAFAIGLATAIDWRGDRIADCRGIRHLEHYANHPANRQQRKEKP